MKVMKDGDSVAVVKDDFENFQVSPSVWFDADSEAGKILLKDGVLGLPLGELRNIMFKLKENKN